MDGQDTITCAFCGDPIGIYESLTVLSGDADGDGDRQTSVAMEAAMAEADSPLMHAACAWFFREGTERPRILTSPGGTGETVAAGLFGER